MIFQKIRRLTKKVFNSKTYVLFFLNRYIPDNLGKIEDVHIDRESKNISVDLNRDGSSGKIEVINYRINYEGSKGYLIYDKLQTQGYITKALAAYKIDKKIFIKPQYIKLVERVI